MIRITVIGTGYVGLVSGAGISSFGHNVICADIDEEKIKKLRGGVIPIYEPGLEELVQRNRDAGRLSFTNDLIEAIHSANVIFIAVGTPQSANGEADISAIEDVAKIIGKNLNDYKVICTKSTVPIGTGNHICELIRRNMPENGEFDYVSNPEFLREGSAVKDFLWPDRLIMGANSDKAFSIMKEIYRPLYINDTPMLHTSVATAEMIKYASNAFLALKISYINEIANLCESVGADVHQVARAMGQDGRISKKFLHPGPGYGGSCFPKDAPALIAIAEANGQEIRTIKAAISANEAQKKRMVDKLLKLMNGSLSDKTVAVLGLSFKPNTNDVRESPAIEMIQAILNGNGTVRAFDPVANESMHTIYPDINYYSSWEEAVYQADCAVIMTEWNEFRGMDLSVLKNQLINPVILDTRNVLNMYELLKLGFTFDNVGRLKPSES